MSQPDFEPNKYEVHNQPNQPKSSKSSKSQPAKTNKQKKKQLHALLNTGLYVIGLGAISFLLYHGVFARTVSTTAPAKSERILAAVNGEPAQLKPQASQDPMDKTSQNEQESLASTPENRPQNSAQSDQLTDSENNSDENLASDSSASLQEERTGSSQTHSDSSIQDSADDSVNSETASSDPTYGFPITPKSDDVVSKTVLLDAGHGGRDTGDAASDGTVEKDIALKLALKIRDQLTLQNPNINVVMVRDGDTGSPQGSGWEDLVWRRSIQDEANADYFLSLHAHSQDENPGMTYYIKPDDWTAQSLVANMESSLSTAGWNDQSDVITTDVYPLQLISMTPSHAVQFELGSLKNAQDLAAMKDETRLDQAAAAIAAAISQTIQENPEA